MSSNFTFKPIEFLGGSRAERDLGLRIPKKMSVKSTRKFNGRNCNTFGEQI
jgi:hypothetical protein